MKKVGKFGLNYHRHLVQPLVLCILMHSFLKNTSVQNNSPGGMFSPPPTGTLLPPT